MRVKGDRISRNLWCRGGTKFFPLLRNVISKFLLINAANYLVSVIFALAKKIRMRSTTKKSTESIGELTNVNVSGFRRVNFTVTFHA